MKRFISFALSIWMIVQMAIPAFAEGLDTNPSVDGDMPSTSSEIFVEPETISDDSFEDVPIALAAEKPLAANASSRAAEAAPYTISVPSGKVGIEIVSIEPKNLDNPSMQAYLNVTYTIVDKRATKSAFTVSIYKDGSLVANLPVGKYTAAGDHIESYTVAVMECTVGANTLMLQIEEVPDAQVQQKTSTKTWDGNPYADIRITGFDIKLNTPIMDTTPPSRAGGIQILTTYASTVNYRTPTIFTLYCDNKPIMQFEQLITRSDGQRVPLDFQPMVEIPAGEHQWKIEANTGNKAFEVNYSNNSVTKALTWNMSYDASFTSGAQSTIYYAGENTTTLMRVANRSSAEWKNCPIGIYENNTFRQTVLFDLPFNDLSSVSLPIPAPTSKSSTYKFVIDPEHKYMLDWPQESTKLLTVVRPDDGNFAVTLTYDGTLEAGKTTTFHCTITNTSKYYPVTGKYGMRVTDVNNYDLNNIIPETALTLNPGETKSWNQQVTVTSNKGISVISLYVNGVDNDASDNISSVSYTNGTEEINPNFVFKYPELPEGSMYQGATYSTYFELTYTAWGGAVTTYPNSKATLYLDGKPIKTETLTIRTGVNRFNYSFDTLDMSLGAHSYYWVIDTGMRMPSNYTGNFVLDNGNIGAKSDTVKFTILENQDLAIISVDLVDHPDGVYKYTDKIILQIRVMNPTRQALSQLLMEVIPMGATQPAFSKRYSVDANSGVYMTISVDAKYFEKASAIQVVINGDNYYVDSNKNNNVVQRVIKVGPPTNDVSISEVVAVNSIISSGKPGSFEVVISNNSPIPVSGTLTGTINGETVASIKFSLGASSLQRHKFGTIFVRGDGSYNLIWKIVPDAGFVDSNPYNNTYTSPVSIVSVNNLFWSTPMGIPSTYVTEDQDVVLSGVIMNSSLTTTYKFDLVFEQDGLALLTLQNQTIAPGGKLNAKFEAWYNKDPAGGYLPDGRPSAAGTLSRWGSYTNITARIVPTSGKDSNPDDNISVSQIEARPYTNTFAKNKTTKALVVDAYPNHSKLNSPMFTVKNFNPIFGQDSRILMYPNAVVRMYCKDDPSIRWVPIDGSTTWGQSTWESVFSQQEYFANGSLSFGYDGTGGKRKITVELLPGTPYARNGIPDPSYYASRIDTYLADNVLEFEVDVPAVKVPRDFATGIQSRSRYIRGTSLDFEASWYSNLTAPKQTVTREILANGTVIWSSSAEHNNSQEWVPMSIPYSTLKDKGVNLSSPDLALTTRINGGLNGPHPIEESTASGAPAYNNNEKTLMLAVMDASEVEEYYDLAITKLTSDKSRYNPGDTVKLTATLVDNSTLKLPGPMTINVKFLVGTQSMTKTLTIPDKGNFLQTEMPVTFTLPKNPTSAYSISAEINPERDTVLKEKTYTNNIQTTAFSVAIPEMEVDYGVTVTPESATVAVGETPTVRFDITAKTTVSPSQVVTSANLIVNGERIGTPVIYFDNNYRGSLTYVLPQKYTEASGAVSIDLEVNPSRVIKETDYSNNRAIANITVKPSIPRNELLVSYLKTDKSFYGDGDLIYVDVGFTNLSDTNRAGIQTDIEVYNAATSRWDKLLNPNTTTIAAYHTTSYSFSMSPSPQYMIDGKYLKLRATINADKKYADTDLSNNQLETQLSIVAALDAQAVSIIPKSPEIIQGKSVNIELIYRNNSKIIPIPSALLVVTDNNKEIYRKNVTLAGGQINTEVLTYTPATSGNHNLIMTITAPDDINPTNDSTSSRLVVTAVNPPVVGENFKAISIGIWNTDKGSASDISIGDYIEMTVKIGHENLSKTNKVSYRILLKNKKSGRLEQLHESSVTYLSGMGANGTVTYTIGQVYAWDWAIDECEFILQVDAYNEVTETNEADNEAVTPVNVGISYNIYFKDWERIKPTYLYGDTINFMVPMKTEGLMATSVPCSIQIYIDGILKHEYPFPAQTGVSADIGLGLTGVKPGDHTIEIRVNENRTVTETTYTDNVTSYNFTVLKGDLNFHVSEISVPTNVTNSGLGDYKGYTILRMNDLVNLNIPISKAGYFSNGRGMYIRTTMWNEFSDKEETWIQFLPSSSPNEYPSAIYYPTGIWYNDRDINRGLNTFKVEINPKLTDAELAEVYDHNATSPPNDQWTVPDTALRRIYEESTYSDNISFVKWYMPEDIDFYIQWFDGGTENKVPPSQLITGQKLKSYVKIGITGNNPYHIFKEVSLDIKLDGMPLPGTTYDMPKWSGTSYQPAMAPSFSLNALSLGEHKLEISINKTSLHSEANWSNNVLKHTITSIPDPNAQNFAAVSFKSIGEEYYGHPMKFQVTIEDTDPKKFKGQVPYFIGTSDAAETRFQKLSDGVLTFDGRDSYTFEVDTPWDPRILTMGTNKVFFIINPGILFGNGSGYISVSPERLTTDNMVNCFFTLKDEPVNVRVDSLALEEGEFVSSEEIIFMAKFTNEAKNTFLSSVETELFANGVSIDQDTYQMGGGETVEAYIPYTLPKDIGPVKFEFVVNGSRQLVETNYNDNTAVLNATVLPAQRDITVFGASIKEMNNGSIIKIGDKINLSFTALNQSLALINPKDLSQIFYTIKSDGLTIASGIIDELILDTPKVINTEIFVPGTLLFGDVTMEIEINPDSQENPNFMDEINFSNNKTQTHLTITPPSNLTIPNVSVDSDIVGEGDDIEIEVTVKNENPAKPLSPEISIEIDGKEVIRIPPTEIPPSGEINVPVTIPGAGLDLGQHEITVIVNPDKKVEEDNYDDNDFSKPILITQSKDYAAKFVSVTPEGSLPYNTNATITVEFRNNGNTAGTVPAYLRVGEDNFWSENITLAKGERLTKTFTVNSGSEVMTTMLELGINTERMSYEEVNFTNNIDYWTLNTRDHNVDGSVDDIQLDKDNTVEIEVDIKSPTTGSIIRADDSTSIVAEVTWAGGSLTGDANSMPVDIPIAPGERIDITVTIVTDDGYLEEEYTVTYFRPSDGVDANVIIQDTSGVSYNPVRTGNHFEFKLPSSISNGEIILMAIADNSNITDVKGDSMLVPSYTIPSLSELFSTGEIATNFTVTSGSGNSSETYTVRVTVQNNGPAISIVNYDEINKAIYSHQGRYLNSKYTSYGAGFSTVESARLADKLYGIPVQVAAKDSDTNQLMFAEVSFNGKIYPVYWLDYAGERITAAREEIYGYAYIPHTDFVSDAENLQLYATAYDTFNNSTASFISKNNSQVAELSIDLIGPTYDIAGNGTNKTLTISNIKDNLVGTETVYMRHKLESTSSWSPTYKFEKVTEGKSIQVSLDAYWGFRQFEVWAEDKLKNVTSKTSFDLDLGGGDKVVELPGAYATNSRKATSVFINVRYRGSEKVDLTGFEFVK